MVRIAPIRLSFNPKTLWFDAGDLELHTGDHVVVTTARGSEFGTVSNEVFDMTDEDAKNLKSPLKPVKRLADDNDVARSEELLERGRLALPIFKQISAEAIPDMNPIAVEYLFDGDKAVFYFEAEDRVDFRELVKKLALEFKVRVDMKQIGVRDEARLVGGIGHCGQELCCRRLGGGFDPVSIRMAKEQDLSLNPQKISGICGRLMCCLRYEYEAYKDFHSRAPKKNAKIDTPDGEGKVVDMNVPREIISIKVGDEKPVKVPLADMDAPEEGARPSSVGEEAWQRANEPMISATESALNLFTSELTGSDKLAEPGKVRHVHPEESERKPSKSRSRRRGSSKKQASANAPIEAEAAEPTRKPRRRRSTTVASDGSTHVNAPEKGGAKQPKHASESEEPRKSSSRRRSRGRGKSGAQSGKATNQGVGSNPETKQKQSQVGRNSSALRAARAEHAGGEEQKKPQAKQASSGRRRRRTHKSAEGGQGESKQ